MQGFAVAKISPVGISHPSGILKGSEAVVTWGGPLVVLYGADLTDVLGRVEAAGGRIVKPVFEFPSDRRFHSTDPEGYELAVWTDA
jgi:hypothetical protein